MEEDTIELIDYLRVVWKRKGLIIIGTLLCMVIAGVVSVMQPKTYRATSVIEIGTLTLGGQILPIEEPDDTKEKIERAFIYNVIEELGLSESFSPDIKVELHKDTRILSVGVDSQSDSVEQAVRVLEKLNAVVLDDHRRVIQSSKTQLQNRIKTLILQSGTIRAGKKALFQKLSLLEKNRENLKEQIKVLEERIEKLFSEKKRLNLDANPDNTLSILVFSNEIQQYQRYYSELQEKLKYNLANREIDFKTELINKDEKLQDIELSKQNIQDKLDNLKETTVIKNPGYEKIPVKPKIKLNILLAGMAGLMFFLFLAFFMEYLERARKA
jgi:uncharacterized protein involved in exopolysaccharide biosynthesis